MTRFHNSAVGPRYQALNEPVLGYARGSAERNALELELKTQSSTVVDIPLVIGGKDEITQVTSNVTAPFDHGKVLAHVSQAKSSHAVRAIEVANATREEWSRWSLHERSEIFLKAADLLVGPWRQRLNAATMLGQGKTVHQAEIDAACELADFLRFNVQFAQEIAAQQPISSAGIRNQMDLRSLEGFVYAVTPFNFTAIGGNLAVAPALMGNTVVWKPASTAALSNYLFMQLLEEAGLPAGVISFLPGDPVEISTSLLASPDFAALHFTGSTAVFDQLWLEAAKNLGSYRNYPRIVGETGGKDFILAHASADVEALSTGILRGAFEYQGQKCSAASRAYIPASLWPRMQDSLLGAVSELQMGDVRDLSNFMSAVIDKKAFQRITQYIDRARKGAGTSILTGGNTDSRVGYFVPPTVIKVDDPRHALMTEEIFGPVLALYIYDDVRWHDVLELIDNSSPYALTGAVFAQDRKAISEASDALRFAAGNFYINDKPTGAVVGQQPFGGARRSGTNDKAGSAFNLLRFASPRTIKETYVPAKSYHYPHMM